MKTSKKTSQTRKHFKQVGALPDWIARAAEVKLRVRNFVDGCWRDSGGEILEKHSPRDGRLLCQFGAGSQQEADEAIAIARRAFEDGRWSRLPVQRRKDVLHKLADLIDAHREELALLECLDVGKPISDALNFDVPVSAALIRHSAESVDHLYGKVYAADQANLSYQLRRPLGVVAGIVGWNFPLALAAQKIGPVLATGNSLVLKPSEFTSLATSRLAELALEAGMPEGVFNVIHGNSAVGAALSNHQDVDLVTFTGSSATGKKLLIASGQSNMKRLVLECGGKAPNIVFDDAPSLEAVADAVIARAFWNQGQVCTASSRLLVHAPIAGELLSLVIKKMSVLRVGDPLSPETKFGALMSREHKQKVLAYVSQAQADGARLVHQGDSPPPFANGFYVPSMIFAGVHPTQRIAQEEIFGPVLSVISFRDEAEAIRIANSTIYGLSAILWTRDLGRAHRMTQEIKAGWITVNATGKPTGGPSAGVMSVGGHKQSGLGVEGGIAGLAEYTSQTAVQMFV
jgi:acyl-CoA reductase-like NAD-dependent aldehyde dehydrogenase